MQRLTVVGLSLIVSGVSPVVLAQVSRSVGSFGYTFEAPALDPEWRVTTLLNETVSLSTIQNHTPTGAQSLRISTTGPGQRNAYVQRTLGGLTKGTATIYFYDSGPGFYAGFDLLDLTTGIMADIGTQDYDPSCYRAFVLLSQNDVRGPNASCGPVPGVETTDVVRTVGWHKFTIASSPMSLTLSIDDHTVFTLGGSFAFDTAQLFVVGPNQANTSYFFDDFSFKSRAECNVQLDRSTYGNGDAVLVSKLRIANNISSPLPIELKIWLGVPGFSPLSLLNVGANGSLALPVGFDYNPDPFTMFQVMPAHPRGTYELGCRASDPVTGELAAEGVTPFMIE